MRQDKILPLVFIVLDELMGRLIPFILNSSKHSQSLYLTIEGVSKKIRFSDHPPRKKKMVVDIKKREELKRLMLIIRSDNLKNLVQLMGKESDTDGM